MSIADQCPSSKKEGLPASKPATARDVSAATGKAYWRSLDDLVGAPEFRDFVEREFPVHASELLDGTRRHFLKLMGASLALAGAGMAPGCRRPDVKILPYNRDPEHIVPGKPLFYATAMPLPGGSCEGVLAETFEGRPTKLEGNPLHPANLGRSSAWLQASVLALYDPDRDPEVYSKFGDAGLRATSWGSFQEWAGEHFPVFNASRGGKLAFLVEKTTSPSRDRLRDAILARWPEARWCVWNPADDTGAASGSEIAFGGAFRPVFALESCEAIVSLDCDFLGADGSVSDARGFAISRFRPGLRPGHEAAETTMSRLYVAESSMTITGGQADHRLAFKPSDLARFGAALGAAVIAKLGRNAGDGAPVAAALASVGGVSPDHAKWVEAAADDLAANRGKSLLMAGPTMPAAIHAMVHAVNRALGNAGKTVEYVPVRGDAAVNGPSALASLTNEMNAGGIDTLVILGGNPVYDAPSDLKFGEALAKVAHRIVLSDPNETARAALNGSGKGVYLARAHYLEAWGDVESWEGVYSIVQPMIAPLFDGHSELEALATVMGEGATSGYEIVRATFSARTGDAPQLAGGFENPTFEKKWRRTLHDGVQPAATVASGVWRAQRQSPPLSWGEVAEAVRGMGAGHAATGVEVVFAPSAQLHDGRFANNGWLQELPHQVTKVAWDNPALVSMATARKLGLNTSRKIRGPQYNTVQVVTVSVGGRSVDVPILVQPGMPDDTIVLTLGYGRTLAGRVGDGTGFDVYPLRTTGAMRVAGSAEVAPAKGRRAYLLANTQDHWSMEGRGILREVDLAAWKRHGDEIVTDPRVQKDHYKQFRDLNFAQRLGVESHAPANRSIYTRRQQEPFDYFQVDENGEPKRDERGNLLGRVNKHGKRIPQWGMTIDLTTCTGCGACTIACQAENNIPIVGKKEVAKGREMHWIRVDRYYAGGQGMSDADFATPDMVVQPVACVHCELAPCEVVCPVNATAHGDSGLNEMAYNRCIGTRYCNNNCPYKVRRFNWFDYATKQHNGGFGQLAEGVPDSLAPENQSLIPPRFRAVKAEVAQLQYNPHVTVRSRGVMEKCTYCIQRLNAAKVETKLHDLKFVPDGFVQAACQQACPSGAIVFGDIFDNDSHNGLGSLVKKSRNNARSYAVLGFLNTRPRTTHLVRVRNPNPALRKPVEDPFHHGHGHGEGDDHHHHTSRDGHRAMPVRRDGREGTVVSLPVLATAGAGGVA